MSRFVIVAAFAFSTLALVPSPVFAYEAEEKDTVRDPEVDSLDDIDITIDENSDLNQEKVDFVVATPGGGSSGSGQGSQALPPGWECKNNKFISNDLVEPVYDFVPGGEGSERGSDRISATLDNPDGTFISTGATVDPRDSRDLYETVRQYSPSGQWAWIVCRDAAGVGTYSEFNPIGGDPVTLGSLFAQAMGEVDPPVHESDMRPEGKQLVQFPSLFWVDPTYWNADRSATRSNGNVSLTVSLVPFETEWDPGDGSDPIICDGPGDVWERGRDSETFDCKHVYRSVKGQPFTLTSTVRFEVLWETNSNEVLGPFPSLAREATTEVGVREIQVVETNG